MDDPQRVARVLEVAEELLAELHDTVFEDCPPEFEPETVVEEPDTVIDPIPPVHLQKTEIEVALDTLSTERPAHPIQWSPPPQTTRSRRSLWLRMVGAIKRWLGVGARATVAADDDGSNAWTYTMADRHVARARGQRASRA